MKIIVCLDERRGLLFGGRRQSKDREVIADILKHLSGRLYLAPYSERLFADKGLAYTCTATWPIDAEKKDTLFAESLDFLSHLEQVDQITVYWWNRHYPSDVRLEADFAELGFHSAEVVEFPGYSHEKITKEIYLK